MGIYYKQKGLKLKLTKKSTMPYGDRTGPRGQGPMTGRGFGFCSGCDAPGYAKPGFRGRGYRSLGWQRRISPQEEKDILKEEKGMISEEIKALENQMKEIEKRIKDLKKSA